MRLRALLRKQALERRAFRRPFQLARFPVELLQCRQLLVLAELGALHGRFKNTDGFVVHFERDRKRMPVLAAVGDREACRIAEPARRAVDDLGDQRQRPYRSRPDAGREQEIGKIGGAAFVTLTP